MRARAHRGLRVTRRSHECDGWGTVLNLAEAQLTVVKAGAPSGELRQYDGWLTKMVEMGCDRGHRNLAP